MAKPFISIIVVAYNYVQFLPRCLGGIEKQNFKDYEVILVNNGSTDDTQAFAQRYINDHPEMNIKLCVVEKNIGLPNGRNVGLEHATGEYVIFNDADDWMTDGCLESLANVARKTNADRIIGDFREVDTEGNEGRICAVDDQMSKWLYTSLQSVLFRRSILEENHIRVPLHTKVDDMYVNMMFSAYSDATSFTHESHYCYFVNQYSTSGAKSNNKSWNSNTLMEDCMDTMEELLPLLKTEEDRKFFIYVMQKQFYFFFLHNNRYTPYRQALKNYHICRKMLTDKYPDYLKNPLVRRRPGNGDRPSGQKIVWLLSIFEKLHVFWVVVLGLHVVSKFKYLNP